MHRADPDEGDVKLEPQSNTVFLTENIEDDRERDEGKGKIFNFESPRFPLPRNRDNE